MLLTSGAKPDGAYPNGETPLRWAVISNHEEIVRLLIAHGANVNASETFEEGAGLCSGWTPLHHAADCGHANTAAVLVAHSADPNARSAWGMTPLDVAQRGRKVEVAEYLAPITTASEDPNALWRQMQGRVR